MNTATFAGRLGRDADLRDTGKDSVCNFSVAVDVGWGDKKRTLWIGCSLWGERAKKLSQYLTKGTSVTVSGDVDLRTYEKKDGTAGAEITCNVQRLTLQGGGEKHEEKVETAKSGNDTPTKGGEFDDDIPF